MLYKFSPVVYLLCLSQVFLGCSYFFSTKAIANSLETEIDQPSNSSFIHSQDNFSHDHSSDQLKSIKQEIEVDKILKTQSTESDDNCLKFIPLTNTIQPNLSPNEPEKTNNNLNPTSSCATDLLGVKNPNDPFKKISV